MYCCSFATNYFSYIVKYWFVSKTIRLNILRMCKYQYTGTYNDGKHQVDECMPDELRLAGFICSCRNSKASLTIYDGMAWFPCTVSLSKQTQLRCILGMENLTIMQADTKCPDLVHISRPELNITPHPAKKLSHQCKSRG